ncbi:cyclic lactone autoinducer peptide [Desulfosporosinus lacus]|nr:cyclic lactone autoinducer peptide [Desulfosporosinus lacus]
MAASFGLLVTTINANTNCICIIHQPKMPQNAEKLRKF